MDACVREHDLHVGASVMVWGGIHRHGRTPLHRIQGNLTGQRYVNEVLQPIVVPTLHAMGPGATLQDDNAAPHRANVVRDFLRQQQIPRLDWSARSPDQAPIEHLWDELGRQLQENHPPPADLHQLTNNVIEEWNSIPQQTLRNLIDSIRRRCAACLDAEGGHTRY